MQSPTGAAGFPIGQELDLIAEYTPVKAATLGFGDARFFTGEFLNRTTPGRDFHYPYAYLAYKF